MILFSEIVRQQQSEVARLREVTARFVRQRVEPLPGVLGVMLSGSVARGDARVGPLGFLVDIVVVVRNGRSIDLAAAFGPSIDPLLPFHCVEFEGHQIALEVRELEYLLAVRERQESEVFARNESMVLYDPTGVLSKWKREGFVLTPEQVRGRCLQHHQRFRYLTGPYRNEKWSYRQAWLQICQNLNEACERHCCFLHCLNRGFVPRNDWLVYLTYELPITPANHDALIHGMYLAYGDQRELTQRLPYFADAAAWMDGQVADKGWR